MACDIQTLIDDNPCFMSLSEQMQLAAIAALLCAIAGGGTGGGTFAGVGSPEGVQVGSPGNTYFDTVGTILWVKQTGTGNTGWFQVTA